MHALYALDMTMQDARDRYFEANGFGADGGYDDAWVDFKIGPVPLPFPNTKGRVKAVKFHDLHHVLTSYETDARGEFEISAWEIGAGCKGMVAAWVINLSGMAAGLVVSPRRIFAAFVRGRRSSTLYGEAFELLLERQVGELRARFVGESGGGAHAADVALFGVTAVAAAVMGVLFSVLTLPLLPVGLVAMWLSRRDALSMRASSRVSTGKTR